MGTRVTVTDFVRAFADYINRVAYAGERFVLVRGRKEIAEVAPVKPGRSVRELPELLRSLPRLGRGDADRFGADVGRARAELPLPRDAWES
jgi:transposase